MNSISGFLSLTTVAAIAISQPFTTIANTALEIAQIKIPPTVLLESPFGSSSLVGIELRKVDILKLCKQRNILEDQEKDPNPPRPSPPGGSR